MIPIRDNIPTRSFSFVAVTLIVANVLIFIHELRLPMVQTEALIRQFGLIPASITGNPSFNDYSTVISSMFLHGGWMHLIGNMLYLWIFGNNIEEAVGHEKFVVFYLLCGIGAAVTQILISPNSTVPMIGASGAVSGVLGAYLLLYPRARVLLLVPIWIFIKFIEVPAFLMLILWFGLQLLSGWLVLNSTMEAGVAFWAHIGGFVAGMALIPIFKQKRFRFFQ